MQASGIRDISKIKARWRNDAGLWERVAITQAQADQINSERAAAGLGPATIRKLDKRFRDEEGNEGRYFDAVETEAFGQARILEALTNRLDELMPEPIQDVLDRETVEFAMARLALREIRDR